MPPEPPDPHQDVNANCERAASEQPAADQAADRSAFTWPWFDVSVDHLETISAGGFAVFQCKTPRGQWVEAAHTAVSEGDAQRLTRAAAGLALSKWPSRRGSYSASTKIGLPVAVDLLAFCDCNPRGCGGRPFCCTCGVAEQAEQRAATRAATVENIVAAFLLNWKSIAKVEPGPQDNLIVLCSEVHARLGKSLDAEQDILKAIGAAHKATQAALEARNSILHDTPTVSYSAVADFTSTWLLARPRTPDRALVEAVTEALLFTRLDDFPDDHELVKRIRHEYRRQRRARRLITETTLCHQSIMSLDQAMLCSDEGESQGTLADLVVSSDSVEDTVAMRLSTIDDRVQRVLNRLKPDELAVTQAYIHCSELGWRRAAEKCGHEPTFGTRVQRKLRRLGQQLLDRIASAPGAA